MIKRRKETEIKNFLRQFPIVAIIGPRQSGKTTISKVFAKDPKLPSLYFDLESPADFSRFENPEYFLESISAGRVIIDEVQRKPELFAILRSLCDKNKRKGQYLLLGSASPHLIYGVSESLAGRIAFSEVGPFNLLEIIGKRKNSLHEHWFKGGFPDAWLCKNKKEWFAWMDNYFRTFIERDLNTLFGTNFSSSLMFKIWRMLAHHHGQIWNAHSISKGLDVSPTTVNKYVDFLEGAFMVRKLPAYFTKAKKRIVKSHKIYIRDSGLFHYLINLTSFNELMFNPSVGFSWEGYAIEQILQLVPYHIKQSFYRTHDGSEMDLVLESGIKPLACIELKTTIPQNLSRGYYESIKDLNCQNNFLVTPSQPTSHMINKNIMVCGLADFLSDKLPKVLNLKK